VGGESGKRGSKFIQNERGLTRGGKRDGWGKKDRILTFSSQRLEGEVEGGTR